MRGGITVHTAMNSTWAFLKFNHLFVSEETVVVD